jgi:aminopeptidase YwaD
MYSYAEKASQYLKILSGVKPNRRTGSAGNRAATAFFEQAIRKFGYDIDSTPFPALDYACETAALSCGDFDFEVFASPYSPACNVLAEPVVVSTVEELHTTNFAGKILILRGPICEEQIMPKNFVFYNPEEHQQIISLLEAKKPAGIVAATKRNPELAGALDPFPLFVDGDFDIASVYCVDALASDLEVLAGREMLLRIDAERIPASAANVVARLNSDKAGKIVITAHIDAYESTPGALDNASGITILLLAAEMLADYQGKYSLEIVALNGEDHYSAGGQMDYLSRYREELPAIIVVINLDAVGYIRGESAYSFYECEPELVEKMENIFRLHAGLNHGEQWYSGDHMVFVQNEVPAVAISSENLMEILTTVAHTSSDTPALVDSNKLVEVAEALNDVVRTLGKT